MNFSEKEIQEHIWENRDRFVDLLIEPTNLDRFVFNEDLSNVSVQSLVKNRIIEKINSLYSKLLSIELIGCEVPLEQEDNSTIRADFLATFPGCTGIGIIELKKSFQTERQSFTELLAYSNHLATLFPGMSRDDLVYILISPMTTRIARDSVIQTLTFDKRNIIALIPTLENPHDLKTLKLELWMPTDIELTKFSNIAFRENNFNVCKIVWEYSEGWWDAAKGENPSPDLVEQLNSVSTIAAQQMEEMGIHGFTYCSQVWSELEPVLPYTNALILVGLNPYSVGSRQFLSKYYEVSDEDLPSPQSYMPNISELIPGLDNHGISINTDYRHLEDLHQGWDSQLFRIGQLTVDSVTRNTSSKILTDVGFMDWHTYQRQFLEDISCHNFLVRPTGLIRQLYFDMMNLDYEICEKVGIENHPVHGDLPHNAIDYLSSQHYFRLFILRMIGDKD